MNNKKPEHTDHWADFLSIAQTYQPDLSVFYQWQKQRTSYAIWMYRFKQKKLIDTAQNIQKLLTQTFSIHLVKQLHMTVFVAGFPGSQIRYDDDIDASILEAQFQCLQSSKLNSPEIYIQKPCSTLTGPTLLTRDLTDTTDQIRSLFEQQASEQRFSDYRPHITLGHYLNRYDTETVYQELLDIPDFTPFIIKPYSLELVYINCSNPVDKKIAICNENYESIYTYYFENS